MRLRSASRTKARIEVIPMIDVIFFLLVFFMISTLSMAVYRGLPVNLPKAATGSETPRDQVMVTVAKDGRIAVDQQDVARESFPTLLKARLEANPLSVVVINADEEVRHGRVVEILDEARRVGVVHLAIAVRPKEPGR